MNREAIVIVIMVLVACIGCSTTMTLDERDERDARHARAYRNWELCKMAYNGLHKRTISDHDHRRAFPHRIYEVEADLRINGCRTVLGKHWVDL